MDFDEIYAKTCATTKIQIDENKLMDFDEFRVCSIVTNT